MFIPTVSPALAHHPPLVLINVQRFQTRRSSPVLRPPFFFLFLCFPFCTVLSSSSFLSFFPTFPPSPNSYTSLPLLLWLSHSLLHKLLVSTFQKSLRPCGVKQQCPLKGDRIWEGGGERQTCRELVHYPNLRGDMFFFVCHVFRFCIRWEYDQMGKSILGNQRRAGFVVLISTGCNESMFSSEFFFSIL